MLNGIPVRFQLKLNEKKENKNLQRILLHKYIHYKH